MLASSRFVFGREFRVTPVWMWVLQRISGLLLGPLVALHVFARDLINARVVQMLLLTVIIAHGYSGLRRIVTASNRSKLYSVLTIAWCAVVTATGILLVISAVYPS